ncbi:MAG: DUF305 domain-containing protein [Leptolyngbyaceae cyanobacterium RM2_2_4]|nr:DUF305 domain-containing protein [Leptolyngbyaceae cyanobacterium SM1_4_3]NJN89725.1 DUF305 domain-containing protein [Leptolyngbyaceae cyanobacterium SL_5_14]NJO49272.1 DUF305 domain-containing protein [Leptolyngbyaceae cyanobacterium RM2_2_4]
MKFRNAVLALTLGGTFAFLSLGLAACSDSSDSSTHSVSQDSSTEMEGMDHGSEMSMDLGPADESFDLRFIDAMILHHQGAVEMAQVALEQSDRDEIKQLSQQIIAAQEQEIQQMQEWRQTWYSDAADEPVMYHAEMGHMMPMSEEMKASMMMDVDLGTADEEFDLRFINAMIPHHEGALTMAEEALEKSDRPEIQQLAQQILASQESEIDQMNQWKQSWYGQ